MAEPEKLRGEIITDPTSYPIKPEDITEIPTLTGFEDYRTEVAALWVVAYSKANGGGWSSFTLDRMQEFYQEAGGKNFDFGGLVEPITVWDRWEIKKVDGGYLARKEEVIESTFDGLPEYRVTYHPTTAFIEAVTKYIRVPQLA